MKKERIMKGNIEIKITVKNEETRLQKRYNVYEDPIELNHDNIFLQKEVDKLVQEFGKDVDDIIINAKMLW